MKCLVKQNNRSGKSKTGNAILLFALLIFFLSIADLDVFLLKIPEFEQLENSEGTIGFDLTALSRGSSLLLINNGKTIKLNCWITSSGIKDCVSKDDRNYLRGKQAKAWWYLARINGIFKEKRLLQLEVNGKIFINYLDQKDKYLEDKKAYLYVWPVFFCLTMFFYILFLLINKFRNK